MSEWLDLLGAFRSPTGVFGRTFCSARHPNADGVWCRRQPHHDGDHAAYVFSIRTPESWPQP